MKHIVIEVSQERDATGDFEEWSWDLFPLVRLEETAHLQDCGVPKVGIRLKPGMVVVGKIAKTMYFDASRKPSALEIHGLSFEELKNRYGRMWQDKSIYATDETCGTVISARVEEIDGKLKAIVEIDRSSE